MNTAVGGWEIFSSAQILGILSRLAQGVIAHENLVRGLGQGVFSTSPPKRHEHVSSLHLNYDVSY